MASCTASTGKSQGAVGLPATQASTDAQVVENPTTGLRDALEQRRLEPCVLAGTTLQALHWHQPSSTESSFLIWGCRASLAASFDSLQVRCHDLALDTKATFSVEQHFVLLPTFYALQSLSASPCTKHTFPGLAKWCGATSS
jgi:hypothetical protein